MAYNQIFPNSQKSVYNPGDIVEFSIVAPGKFIELNKITISGNLTVSAIDSTDPDFDINYDSLVGVHGFVNNFTVRTQNQGTIENLSNYPRMVKMQRSATLAIGDVINSTRYTPELVCPDDSLTKTMLINTGTLAAPCVDNAIAFSMIPDICLNRAMSYEGVPAQLSYDSVGRVTIAFRLVQALEAMYGANVTTYTMSDLRLEFRTVPQVEKQTQTVLQIVTDMKQTLDSSNSMFSINLPISMYSVSCSFLMTSHENQAVYNNLELEMPLHLSRVYFQFNDSTNGYLTSPLETLEDIIENYLDSFGSRLGKNDFTLEKLNNNQACGVGVAFGDAIALASSSFGINIFSDASSAAPYYIFIYLRSNLQL